jgi:hypothetical protein
VLLLLALATRDYSSKGRRGLLASGLARRGGGGSEDDGGIAGDYSESLLYHNRASRPHVHEHEMCSWETSQPVRGACVLRCRVLLQRLAPSCPGGGSACPALHGGQRPRNAWPLTH